MRFRCKCGNAISNTSDYLPYSARVIADIDIYDYWEAWERTGRGQALGNLLDPMDYEQVIYQCEECGRIWFDDPTDPARLICFVPEDKNVMVTGPIEGKKWKGFIYGYSDLGMDRSIGLCRVCWNNGTSEEYRSFETYEDMRVYFDAKVEELKGKNLLRRAWVDKDGETIYRWNLDDEVPVQEKHELYLTEDERIALAEFQTEHAECHHRYPRGPKGWDFAYEVFPGICGADDRDLKATCLRCGATVESVKGRIVRKDGRRPREATADGLTCAVLDLLHERGSRDIRAESISMPERYYEVAEAIGYVRGLVDAVKMQDSDTPLVEIEQRVFSMMLDEKSFSASPKLRNLIRHACEGEGFDWAIEDGIECLKVVLKEQYPNIVPDWLDEPRKERSRASMLHKGE